MLLVDKGESDARFDEKSTEAHFVTVNPRRGAVSKIDLEEHFSTPAMKSMPEFATAMSSGS